MSLQVHLIFEGYLTELTAKTVPFLNVLQVLPFEMFADVAFAAELVDPVFDGQIRVADAFESSPWPPLLVHGYLRCF